METVTTDVVLLGDLIRKSICVSLRRHCLMESRVEDSNLGCACRKNVLACLDTDKVCGIVERAQREALPDDSLNVVVNDDGSAVVLTAVEDSVTYCSDL